jgi:hypothetical protein
MNVPMVLTAGAALCVLGFACQRLGPVQNHSHVPAAFHAARAATVRSVAQSTTPAMGQIPVKGSRCALPIPNGRVLQQSWGILRVEHANTLKIANHSAQNAIIKVKDPMLGRTRLALFVARGKDVTYDALPEGKYIVDYALGQYLEATCMTFAHLSHAEQIGYFGFMGADSAGGSRYRVQELTIPAAPDLDADMNAIDEDTFNFD